jgi:hypothetical protein
MKLETAALAFSIVLISSSREVRLGMRMGLNMVECEIDTEIELAIEGSLKSS